jgi:hypothetical protein
MGGSGVVEIFAGRARTTSFIVVSLLLTAMFVTLSFVYGPGDRAFQPFLAAAGFFGIGAVYLVRRVRKPLLRLDDGGLTYFPFDDPVTLLLRGRHPFVPWPDIREVRFTNVRGMRSLLVIGIHPGQRLMFSLSMLDMPAEELLRELQARAPQVQMPV